MLTKVHIFIFQPHLMMLRWLHSFSVIYSSRLLSLLGHCVVGDMFGGNMRILMSVFLLFDKFPLFFGDELDLHFRLF